MNTKNLNLIISNYISRYEDFNDNPDGANENFKWFAVHDFGQVFDLEAPDFAAMLKKACKATSIMIDNFTQPFGGLVAMAEKKGEAENIREMFRQLYADDGGDLTIQQEKITDFVRSCDELLEKHYPSSFHYKNDQRSAMAYLWFHDPDHHYMCRTSDARYLAEALEIYSDWGTYNSFQLDVYYQFCDTLLEELKKNEALMDLHQSRFVGHEEEMDPDKALHILVFDIIYCARTYGLYTGVKIKNMSPQARKLYQQRRDKADELAAALSRAEQNSLLLQEGISLAEELVRSGAPISHKTFGPGELVDFDGEHLVIRFAGYDLPKKFSLISALANGILTLDAPEFPEFLEKYGAVLKQPMLIPQQLKNARDALEPYASYLE